ncbi:MAG TPA: squalene synthase HpnC [Solirubrobacteraceae bacterium]|jgi:squalene synthase HpnC
MATAAPTRAAAIPPPGAEQVMARAGGENFPVASLLLPRRERAHLLAIYGFARLVDELGDGVGGEGDLAGVARGATGGVTAKAGSATAGERLAALDWLEGELDAAYSGQARHPLMRALSPTLAACELPREPFVRLIEANRADQRVRRYETWEQLQDYCALSANPVGELVLRVFGLATPQRIALSDRICTALQLVEHCQDVAEDLRENDRVYLPAVEMRTHGCEERELRASSADAPLRAVIALQLRRVRALIAEGRPLIGSLRGRPRLAIAAYAAGGLAAADAIEAADCDVLSSTVTAGRLRRLRALGRVLRSATGSAA